MASVFDQIFPDLEGPKAAIIISGKKFFSIGCF
jgi:hypothetical protein